VYCLRNTFTVFVIPVEAGIQGSKGWIPHQVRHDSIKKCKELLETVHL